MRMQINETDIQFFGLLWKQSWVLFKQIAVLFIKCNHLFIIILVRNEK